jgi:hypothetical protein
VSLIKGGANAETLQLYKKMVDTDIYFPETLVSIVKWVKKSSFTKQLAFCDTPHHFIICLQMSWRQRPQAHPKRVTCHWSGRSHELPSPLFLLRCIFYFFYINPWLAGGHC